MSYESMSIIEGKFKLPMLRGEHTQKIQHFREMETSIASDLTSWLCNIYVEVRHMSLHELGATEEMLKSADFDLDYFNKVAVSDSALKMNQSNKKEHLSIEIGSEKHKAMIARNPLTPFELMVPASPSERLLFERQQFSTDAADGPKDGEENASPMKLEKDIADIENQIEKEQAKQKKQDEEEKEGGGKAEEKEGKEEDSPFVQLPVDKGIFRRKIQLGPESMKDLEMGDLPLGNSGTNNNRVGFSDSEDQKKYQKPKNMLESFILSIGLSQPKKISNFQNSGKAQTNVSSLTGGGNGTNGASSVHNSSTNEMEKLLPNDSFLEHKQKILSKWKSNLKKKYPHNNHQLGQEQFYDRNEVMEVRERGYHLEDEAFLHKYQRGKLAGLETIDRKDNRQWAAATIEADGGLIRK
jgi:hypothetical protein